MVGFAHCYWGLHAPFAKDGALAVLVTSYLNCQHLSVLASTGSASALVAKGALL